ncbi:cupin domain-containing protein [Kitasatospora sp. NPDC088346]|uniref:cupin domain-containing protein n=1 Tax=Kitasatospora sp. NPDC088346 TaxID=3364073 RepID=UPI00382AC3D7
MDALAGLLAGPRARGAFLLRSVFEPPWSVRIQDEAPLTVLAPVRGEVWVIPAQDAAVLLRPGDLAIARGPQPYPYERVDRGAQALRAATSLRVAYVGGSSKGNLDFEVALDDRGDCTGRVDLAGRGSFEFVKAADRRWIRPSPEYWSYLARRQSGGAVPENAAGRYLAVHAGSQVAAGFESMCDLDRLRTRFGSLSSGLGTLTEAGTETVAGVRAVKYHSAGAEEKDIYLAADGTPYPVKVETLSGTDRGTVWFSAFDRPVTPTAPPADQVLDGAKANVPGIS